MSIEFRRRGLEPRVVSEVLTGAAVHFVRELHAQFQERRDELLRLRSTRDAPTDFDPQTSEIRESDWTCAPPHRAYSDRRVEITGPTDRKLVINALNSGAQGFMADFEDANSPTWSNQTLGQLNLIDALRGDLTYTSATGRHYELDADPAQLLVRPRGWHLSDRHATVNGEPLAGALLDFGLHAFHCAPRPGGERQGLYFYLPKLEHYLEARLWNDIFTYSEDALGMERGTIRATVLIETLPAAFQMHEILWELRDHSYGLNAGRWDYIFSAIKCFRDRAEYVLPDRSDVTMTVPFMHAYAEALVHTCHARGTFAMGGMAALIPSRTDEAANQRAFAAVAADKRREATAGFDGTWVAHPDVVAIAAEAFDAELGQRPNQITKTRDDVTPSTEDLLAIRSTPGAITEAGLRSNVNVAFQYISFWLGGRGAAAVNHMMEDAATAEISRAQLWQWIRHGAQLDTGETVTRELVEQILEQEMQRIRSEVGERTWEAGRPEVTREIFAAVSLGDDFPDFLTLVAYEHLDP